MDLSVAISAFALLFLAEMGDEIFANLVYGPGLGV